MDEDFLGALRGGDLRGGDLATPAYVLSEPALRRNCEKLAHISEKSGAKILLALKGFAFTPALKIVAEYLSGAACSGLWEAKLAAEFMRGAAAGTAGAGGGGTADPAGGTARPCEIHAHSPAFTEGDFDELASLSTHLIFNSLSQFHRFKSRAPRSSFGLRVNPGRSAAPVGLYDPCSRFSRLGIASLDGVDLAGVEGLHFHALCEQGAQALAAVLEAFEARFGSFLRGMSWVNLGGGHHLTRKDYDVDLLIGLLRNLADKYGVQVILEPGEAVGWHTGVLAATVVDLVENEKQIAILDCSAEAHMSDTIIMPYTPEVAGARILASREQLARGGKNAGVGKNAGESGPGEFAYILAGNTCLAGDVMGEYAFARPLRVGERVFFLDQMHYSIVKNTSFNGIRLPSFVSFNGQGLRLEREFDYADYARRN